MEKQELGGFQIEKKQENPLSKVENFCRAWEAGNIVSFKKSFLVERLDKNGEQIGIYVFNNKGELVEFDMGEGLSKMDDLIKDLNNQGIEIDIIEIENSNLKGFQLAE